MFFYDEESEFEFKVGKLRKRKPKKDKSFFDKSRRFQKTAVFFNFGHSGRGRRGRTPRALRFRSTVHFAQMKRNATTKKILKEHTEYLKREGASQKIIGDVVASGAPLNNFEKFLPGERRIHKLMLSPVDGLAIDLPVFVNAFMARLQNECGGAFISNSGRDVARECPKGQVFDWSAVYHYNTPHPHAHILIRGLDHQGQPVFIPREVIKRGGRALAEEVYDRIGPGYTLTPEILEMRKLAYSTNPSVIDAIVQKQLAGVRTSYRDFLSELSPELRMTAHSRVIYLWKSGLAEFDNGLVLVKPGYERELERIRGVFTDVQEAGVLKYSAKDKLVWRNYGSVSLGVYSGTLDLPGGRVGVMESIDGSAVVFPVDVGHDLAFHAGDKVELRGNTLKAFEGSMFERVKKTKNRGTLAIRIMAEEAEERGSEY